MGIEANIFELNDIRVTYGFRVAVENVSLSLKSGESVGILGLNGAGKTSTLRVLLGLIRPKAGQVKIFGGPTGKVAAFKRIGFAPEEGAPPDYLTGEEYLDFVGALKIADKTKRRAQVTEMLDWFELLPKKRISAYSKGMKRRILLAQAFLGDPELLILDEPLNGLDPLVILKLRDRLDQYVRNGGALLMCSHILTEVEKLCSRAVILKEGRVRCDASVNALVQQFGSVEQAFATKLKEPA